MKRTAVIWGALIIILMMGGTAFADVDTGLSWLEQNQNPSGSWGNTPSSKTTQYLSTTAALTALTALGQTDTSAYTSSIDWLKNSAEADNTAYLATRILSLSGAGTAVSTDIANLLSYQNADGAWGGHADYDSSGLHTALAMDALNVMGSLEHQDASLPLTSLMESQNDDGGWGLSSDKDSSTFVTAIVVKALAPYASFIQVATALNKAEAYLLSHQNADGGFGSSPSTIYETALAYEALKDRITDATVLGSAIAYLESTQSADGSWDGDAYSTALALGVVGTVDENTPEPEVPTTGIISGSVVDASTGQPIGGVNITVAGSGEVIGASDVDGGFSVELAEDPYSISLSLAGYDALNVDVTVTVSEVTSLGTIQMTVPVTSANVIGIVSDSATGAPLAGIVVTLSGAHEGSAVTAEDGSYSFMEVAPGDVFIEVNAAGYYSVSGSGTLVAGTNFRFSPALVPVSGGTGGAATSIRGFVIDGVSGIAIGGATITSGAYSALTSANGDFEFEVEPGTQSVSIAADGYAITTATANIPDGVIYDLGEVKLYANPTVGTVSINVFDRASGYAIEDAQVTLDAALLTGADGMAEFLNVIPGSYTVSVSAVDYESASANVEVTAGGIVLIDFAMASTLGSVTAKILDADTGMPIDGATMEVEGVTTVYGDTDGIFTADRLAPGSYVVNISADGYAQQIYDVVVASGVATSIGEVKLALIPVSATVSGRVTDALSFEVIAGATVSVISSDTFVKSGIDGSYELTGIDVGDIAVRVSAEGYDSRSFNLQIPAVGNYTLDVELNESANSGVRFSSLAVDKPSYKAHESVNISYAIETLEQVVMSVDLVVEIIDENGNVIDIKPGSDIKQNLHPAQPYSNSVSWATVQNAPGIYKVRLKALKDTGVIDPYTGNSMTELIAIKDSMFTIEPTELIIGSVALSPPVTMVDFKRPIEIMTALRNTGNVPVSASLTLTVDAEGVLVYTEEREISGLAVNDIIKFDLGSFVPLLEENYTATLRASDSGFDFETSSQLLVGAHPSATFELNSTTVDSSVSIVQGTIRLEGVGLQDMAEIDPMAVIVKDAVQKGVNYQQVKVMEWHNEHECNGCHIQAQALVGLEASRNIADVDESITRTLFDAFVSWQGPNGGIGSRSSSYGTHATNYHGLWALTYWHDQEEVKPYLLKSADYALSQQSVNGDWGSGMHNVIGYLFDHTNIGLSMAYDMLGVLRAYEFSGDEKYLKSLEKATSYFMLNSAMTSKHTALQGLKLLGFSQIRPVIKSESYLEYIDQSIEEAIQIVKEAQMPNGGWRYSENNVSEDTDSYITSIMLYSLLKAGVSSEDKVIEDAISFLLSTQAADGSWESELGYVSTRLATTTWAMIALPLAYEKIRGIDAEVALTLPDNISIVFSEPALAESEDGIHKVILSGVDENFSSLDMTFEVSGINVGETVSVTETASLAFADKVTGETFTVDISVPSVTRTAPFDISLNIDSDEYAPNQEVGIDIDFESITASNRDYAMKVGIVDQNGNEIAVLSNTVEPVFPASMNELQFRIPVDVEIDKSFTNALAEIELDFNTLFTDAGMEGETVDEDSIRVIEFSEYGTALGEKQFDITTESDGFYGTIWIMDGKSVSGTTRHFSIYFNPSSSTEVPQSDYRVDINTDVQLAYLSKGKIHVGNISRDGIFSQLTEMKANSDVSRIALDDFNNDGYFDIASGTAVMRWSWIGGYGIDIFLNNADESNTYSLHKMTRLFGALMEMASGDFDGDGNVDIVTSTYGRERIYTVLGNGYGGGYEADTLGYPYGQMSYGKDVADLDNDGDLDLVLSLHPQSDSWYRNYSSGILISLNDGDANFTDPVPVIITKEANGDTDKHVVYVVAGDFDSDGNSDIIYRSYRWGESYLMKGNGDGTFQEPQFVESLGMYEYARFVKGDFNSDGNLDLVTGGYYEKKMYIHFGNGDGTFGEPVETARSEAELISIATSPARHKITVEAGASVRVSEAAFNYTWNTGTHYAGQYQVSVEFSDASGDVFTEYAPFNITAGDGLGSSIVSDKVQYASTEMVELNARVYSKAINYNYENLTASITVAGINANFMFGDSYPVPLLVIGQHVDHKAYFEIGSSPAGTYKVILEVKDASGSLLSASVATFEVLSSEDTGSGISGTLSAMPALVKRGSDETLAYSISNDGNTDFNELEVIILIVNPEDESIIHEESIATSLMRSTTAMDTFNLSTSALSAGRYLAILRAKTSAMDEPKTLDSAVFEVESPTIEASKITVAHSSVLVWINYNEHGNNDYPDVAAISSAISATGLNYFMVYDKKDFQRELRSPFYTDYVILGDHHPIEGHFSDELREKVSRGSGLVSSMFNRNNLDSSVFGIKFRGNLQNRDCTVEMGDSEISAQGVVSTAGDYIKIDALGLTNTVGWIVKQKRKGQETYPAAVMSNYGMGRSVLFAFDLGLSVSMDDNFGRMLTDALIYTHRESEEPTGQYGAYALVPLELTLSSLGDPIIGRVSEGYPSGFALYDPLAGTWATENPWVFDVALAAGELRTVPFYALTPDSTGTHVLKSEIGYVEDDQYGYIADIELPIDVIGTLPLMQDAETLIKALEVSIADAVHVNDARLYLSSAYSRSRATKDDIHESINDLIQAIDSLLKITSADVTAAVSALDDLLMSYEGMWYFKGDPSQ